MAPDYHKSHMVLSPLINACRLCPQRRNRSPAIKNKYTVIALAEEDFEPVQNCRVQQRLGTHTGRGIGLVMVRAMAVVHKRFPPTASTSAATVQKASRTSTAAATSHSVQLATRISLPLHQNDWVQCGASIGMLEVVAVRLYPGIEASLSPN